MKMSRRTFLATGAATAALLYTDGGASVFGAARGGRGVPFVPATELAGEDGSKLWLRYAKVPNAADYTPVAQRVVADMAIPDMATIPTTMGITRQELVNGLKGMIGYREPQPGGPTRRDDILFGTPKNSAKIKGLNLDAELQKLGDEGFVLRSVTMDDNPVTVIASQSDIGVLYGAFHFLRLIATERPIDKLNVSEMPAMKIRMTNHWDNITGSIERGYAGRSLWFSSAFAQEGWKPDARVAEYARFQASLGMNGACLNNVNATADLLRPENLAKIALIADMMRPYGVRVYLSANFGAPRSIGGMQTNDPNDPAVQEWWKKKADEIYQVIPDFGGMLVKANSEGQPGPKDYNRTHAEGANCLAAGFAPHNGIVIWRAFVYDDNVDPDRVKRAYKEFMPLDGKFLPNVLVQIKNGPLDFQPREPFHPLFGGLTKTSFLAELQPSQEYLGQARHLVYLGTMWEEFLQADTFAKGPGSTVAKVLEAKVQPVAMTGIAGVLNPGLDANWTGHHFSQANWYALGRMAWNPKLSARAIAEEWTRMTFTSDAAVVKTIVDDIMMPSREAFLNYTMPLGLHHLIGGDHYAPMPQNSGGPRRDWTAVYYHQADKEGIGFDRTRKGDGYVDQYFKPLSDMFDSLETCPEQYLLWFHHLPWDYKMKSGKTLWTELVEHYDKGVTGARAMRKTWAGLADKIDARRHKEVSDRLAVQVADALSWRNRILQYFANINGLPVPDAPA